MLEKGSTSEGLSPVKIADSTAARSATASSMFSFTKRAHDREQEMSIPMRRGFVGVEVADAQEAHLGVRDIVRVERVPRVWQ